MKTVAVSLAVIAGIYVVVGVTLFLLLDAAVAAVGTRVQHHHFGSDDGVVRGQLSAVYVDDS